MTAAVLYDLLRCLALGWYCKYTVYSWPQTYAQE